MFCFRKAPRPSHSGAFLRAFGGAGDCSAPAKLRTRFTAGRFSVWDGVSSRTRKEPRRKIPPRLLASADRTPACANFCAGGRLFDKVAIQKNGCVAYHFACRPPLPHTPAKIAHPFTFFVFRTCSFLSERRFLPRSRMPAHPHARFRVISLPHKFVFIRVRSSHMLSYIFARAMTMINTKKEKNLRRTPLPAFVAQGERVP